MADTTRRMLLAAAGTLAVGAALRKPGARAAEDLLGMGALRPTDPPKPLPEVGWTSAEGAARHLADHVGQGVVLNFWATWCAPCVAEMPSLDRLARALEAEKIAVLPLSSDRGGAAVVERFYASHGITSLPVLLDARGAAARALGARGLPTTLVLDRAGREVARLEGGADWGSQAAVERIRALVGAMVDKT